MAKAVKSLCSMLLQQHLCPEGQDSWCGYQCGYDAKTDKHKNGIPKPIVVLVQPIFSNLADPAKKCTHGLAQNPNVRLNGII